MRLLYDLETDGLLEEVTKIHCVVIRDLDSGNVECYHDNTGIHPRNGGVLDGLSVLAHAEEHCGHNIQGYDEAVIKKLYPTWTHSAKVSDTLILSRVIWPDLKEKDFERLKCDPSFHKQCIGSHALKAWGHRLGEHKGDFGDKENAWEVFTQEMLDYCIQDTAVNLKLLRLIESKKLDPRCHEVEHTFRALIDKQETTGFPFDIQAAGKLYAQLAASRDALTAGLIEAGPRWFIAMKTPAYYELSFNSQFAGSWSEKYPTKGEAEKARVEYKLKPSDENWSIDPGPMAEKPIEFNPGSRDHVARWFKEKYNWKAEVFTPEGKPEISEAVLDSLPFPEAKTLVRLFHTTKAISMLAEGKSGWMQKVKPDGRIHGRVNTAGAVTGRCTHSGPNIAQVPKVQVGKDKKPIHGEAGGWGWECRSLFTAPPGMVLVGCDAAGLELRCLGHYMAPYDDGAYAKVILEGDVHSINQKAAGLPSRDISKTFIYAFLYGAGDGKIGSIVNGSAAQGKKLKAKFLRGVPALARLKAVIDKTMKERGFLKGLDGRQLPVRSAHAALNTLLQSAGAIAMKRALIELNITLTERGLVYGTDFSFLANIHDEFQIAARPDQADGIGRDACLAISRAGEYFGFRCRLDGEFKVGRTWAETH